MFQIKDVTIKNFLSVGQVTQVVKFENGKATLILGQNEDYGEGIRNGVGKAQPLNSKIKTPHGWKTMKRIEIGDFVCTPHGTTTLVVGKFPQGKKKIYKITTSDGRETRACAEHLWEVKDEKGVVQVINTTQLIKGMSNNKKYFIECLEEVDNTKTIQVVDPYTLGAYLGNGFMGLDSIYFYNLDDRIKNKIEHDNTTFRFKRNGQEHHLRNSNDSNTLGEQVRKITRNKKCIPELYMEGDLKQRKELLRGILDVAGEINGDKITLYLDSENDTLARDICELTRSLGGMCNVRYSVYTIKQKAMGIKQEDKIILDMTFRNKNEFFTLEEKKDFLIKDHIHYQIIDIKEDGEEEAACIKVLDDRELYITDDYITTHNTTIPNALFYALTGKVLSKIKKQDSIVNNINKKNMLVTTNFSVKGKEYRLERGRKPNVLKFIEITDGEEKDVFKQMGENKETQKFIEETIGISESVLRHIVFLNTYTEPFMDSSAAKQREVIEEILGISILTQKAERLSEKLKQNKIDLGKEEVRIQTLEESNKRIERNIENLITNKQTWDENKNKTIKEYLDSLDELKALDIDKELEKHEKNKELDDLITQVNFAQRQYNTIKSGKDKNVARLTKLYNQMESFKENICPTCKQGIKEDSEDHQAHKENLSKEISELLADIDKAEKDMAEFETVLNEFKNIGDKQTTFYTKYEDALNHKNMISSFEAKIIEKSEETNPYDSQIEELKNGENGIQKINYDVLNELETEQKHLKFMQKLLTNRDSFVRKRIIEQSLPFLNKRIPFYLEKLSLPHKVEFDSDLTFDIQKNGIEIDFGNLSRGEQNRTIIALNLGFRDLYENLIWPINLVFVDELLDFGIDTSGAIEGYKALKSLSRDKDKSVFLVSHKDELLEYSENVLMVKMVNNFTMIETDESI